MLMIQAASNHACLTASLDVHQVAQQMLGIPAQHVAPLTYSTEHTALFVLHAYSTQAHYVSLTAAT
jgi:hypothetical protein